MHRRGMSIVLLFVAIAFAANACAGKRIETEPKLPVKHEDPIKLEVRPQMVMATPRTATIQLTVIIDPNPNNIYIKWSWDSPDGEGGSSGRSVDGNSQKKFRVFIELTPGNYEIRATVYRSNDESFSVKSTVNVIGGEVSPF